MTRSEEIYLIIYIGKKKLALNTCSIESIHSSASINFNEDLSRCLPGSGMDWDKSVPIIYPEGSSNNEDETSFVNHSSRVIFLSNSQAGRSVALIVNRISKVVNISSEKGNLNESRKTDFIEQIQINNKVVEILDIQNVFMT